MKKHHDAVVALVFTTGVSSVVSQLLIIREFLAQFSGNEFVIALIFFNWLVATGLGTLVAKYGADLKQIRVSADILGLSSFFLSWFPIVQILFLRYAKDVFFIHGTSHGFYPVLGFSFLLMAPYCVVMGFVLPFSLYILRHDDAEKSGTFIYLLDGMGDVTGGALFSFVLIFFFTPCQALIFSGGFLCLCTLYFCRVFAASSYVAIIGAFLTPLVFMAGVLLEFPSLAPREGRLVEVKESLYGRVAVHEDNGQFTLFADGVPAVTSPHTTLAQEIVHYPMCQIPLIDDVLVISGEAGIMAEIAKYHANRIQYIELDADVSRALMGYGMITSVPGLRIINADARKWLTETNETFHAVLMNMPEPDTFQANRFYTDEFFQLVHVHMADTGIFSFHIDGYDTYITDAQLAKVSVIYATLKNHFPHVALIPSDNIFFLCSNHPIDTDIPQCLADKDISAPYLSSAYYGNVGPMKREMLMNLIDQTAPANFDLAPRLMRLTYRTWFEKFSTSPVLFVIGIVCLCAGYLSRVSRGQYVLYTTGVIAMGSEILIIFLYQILYGYIYYKIGMIVTLFLAGLLPGAYFGNRIIHRIDIRRILPVTDGLIMLSLLTLFFTLKINAIHLPEIVLLALGAVISLLCGFQFPLASILESADNKSISGAFTADLMGAASGILVISLVLIPYGGINGALTGLFLIKLSSMVVIKWKPHP